MRIAVLFAMVRKCLFCLDVYFDRMDQLWDVQMIEHYAVMKMNEVLLYVREDTHKHNFRWKKLSTKYNIP